MASPMDTFPSLTVINPSKRKRSFEEMSKPSVKDGSESSIVEDFCPRRYQIEVLEVAKGKNTIAVLGTGAGKTMIAVMLIREVGLSLHATLQKKLIIFLAPTVHLVNQQFEVIKMHTSLNVEQYYGAKGVDDWTKLCWEKEIMEHDVMVMTPQILLDALRKAFLNLDLVCLLVLDECHRTTGNHPYAKIMKDFYHKSAKKPKVFGMTASPVSRKGVSSSMDCEDQISSLESMLDSKVYTVEDRNELEVFVPSAKEVTKYYDPNSFLHEELKGKLESLWSKYDGSLAEMQTSMPSQFKDTEDAFTALRRKLTNYHLKILHCLDDLGFLCAHEATKVCLETERDSSLKEECELYKTCFGQCKSFLEEVLRLFEEYLQKDQEKVFIIGCDHLEATSVGYISPKLYELIQIFQSFGLSKEVLCLIFVERIITAKVIERFIKRVSYLSHFTVSYLTGGSSSVDALTPKMQKKTLDSFRSGEVNLLFTTDVAEEGINVPNCSYVIRFDLPKTVRSYVQSRGRARQHNSQYVLMLERGNNKQKTMLYDVVSSERSMTDTTMHRDPDTSVPEVDCVEETNTYVVESTGASVTADCSVSLIYRYCEKLPGDKYFTPKPLFHFTLSGGYYECTLTLPPNAAFPKLCGPLTKNSHLAKQLVCLEACKRLHEAGALDDHLLPSVEEILEKGSDGKTTENASRAGTTKRKELHGTTSVHALAGSWGDKTDGICLNAYRLDFQCKQIGEFYAGFVLLIEANLDDEVANAKVDLFLIPDKVVKSSVSRCGKIQLDAEQVKNARLFQEFFFNGLFGRLFVGSKSSGMKREFLLNRENQSLWKKSNMYMLLPLESNMQSHGTLGIDWRGINSCASVVELLKKLYLEGNEYSANRRETSTVCSTETDCKSSEVIHLADSSFHIHNLKDIVVLAIHTGRIYSVLEVVTDKSADSSFDGESGELPPDSFKDYFRKRYGIVLQNPSQPMLRLKQSHNPHNLLSNPKKGSSSRRKGPESISDPVAEKSLQTVHMPPELLVNIDVPISVLKSFYLLPSLMHRLKSLMLANQLREEISLDPAKCRISSSLIVEALTTQSCCEDFSLERLELLGDSVLKYAVGCHLFLKYPKKHEGQLSSLRSWAVCNSTLHKLGTTRKLQGYIRDTPFEARRWVAPGQHTVHPNPCKCKVDTLEVPLEEKFVSRDIGIVVGKACDKGHRWMCSKTIADCAEALIGAYYVKGGLNGALSVMKWFCIDTDFDSRLVDSAIFNASLRCRTPEDTELKRLESKLNYSFSIKGFLLEAMTHASQQELGLDYCYQRLEYLGDCVLDLLITRYLFKNHTDVDPGELTDLRSASVNNENFAQAAIRHDLQHHLHHSSGLLSEQITEYVKFVGSYDHSQPRTPQSTKCPKALGDLVESIAGAILIDTRLNLDEVWRVFKPLLSPIVTPEKLELPPLRELIELCSHLGYFMQESFSKNGEMVHAEIQLQLKDDRLTGKACERNKKSARGKAALCILQELEERGISHSRYVSRRKDFEIESVEESSAQNLNMNIPGPSTNNDTATRTSKKIKIGDEPSPAALLQNQDSHVHVRSPDFTAPEVTIKLQKGGPRTSLFELCKKLQWPLPKFSETEEKLRYAVEIGDGPKKRMGANIFVSKISLHIPNTSTIQLRGEQSADKNSAKDSAALAMLYELRTQGKCIFQDL